MSDEVPIFDTSSLPEILFEEIRDLSVHNGIFRCTLYAFRMIAPFEEPVAVPVMNVAMPVDAVPPCAFKALDKVTSHVISNARDFVREKVTSLLN